MAEEAPRMGSPLGHRGGPAGLAASEGLEAPLNKQGGPREKSLACQHLLQALHTALPQGPAQRRRERGFQST